MICISTSIARYNDENNLKIKKNIYSRPDQFSGILLEYLHPWMKQHFVLLRLGEIIFHLRGIFFRAIGCHCCTAAKFLEASLKLLFRSIFLHSESSAKRVKSNYFNTMYHVSFIILYLDQQMHNYFTNYHTATCFDIIVPSSGSL